MKRMNRDGPPALAESDPLRRLEPQALGAALARKELVIDLRRADDFAASHIPGTISIPLTRAFAGYAGWVLPYDRDLYLLVPGEDEAPARRAASELAMIGLDRVTGWIGADAVSEWKARGGAMVSSRQIAPTDVAAQISTGTTVVDVRSAAEWRTGHVTGSLHVPLGRLVAHMADKPRDRPVILLCESGSRSAIGASLLTAAGFSDVSNLTGGIAAWRREGLPLEVDTVVFAASA
jgi:hydroxyacylglutathione hydrolase